MKFRLGSLGLGIGLGFFPRLGGLGIGLGLGGQVSVSVSGFSSLGTSVSIF